MIVGLTFTVMYALDIADAAKRAFPNLVGGHKGLIVIVDVTDLRSQCCEIQQRLRVQALEERAELGGKVFVINGDVVVTIRIKPYLFSDMLSTKLQETGTHNAGQERLGTGIVLMLYI